MVSSTPSTLSTGTGEPSYSTNSTTLTFNTTWTTTPLGNGTTIAPTTTTTVLNTTTPDLSTFTTSTTGRNATDYVHSTEDDSKDSMSAGGYAGISISCSVVFIMLVIIIFVVIRRNRRRKKFPRSDVVPKLPSASDVDKTIRGLQGNNGGNSLSDNTEFGEALGSPEMHSNPELYRNIDQYGNPTDKTNPNVGEDGYLRKTSQGIQYKKEGKKKGRKKKIKDKFDKKKNKSKAQDSNQIDDVESEMPRHGHGSEIGYTEGRAALGQEKGYSDVRDISRHQNENKLYENLGNPNDRYANLQTFQHKGPRSDSQQENVDMQQIYENT